jgi:GntR family transcriptional regulator
LGEASVHEAIRDPRTLVVQLRDRIASLIKDAGMRPGDRLPTEAELTQRFGISRPALREALKLLEQDDLIFVKHGRGRYVSTLSAVSVDRPITVFESASEMTRQAGYEAQIRVLSLREEAPDPQVSFHLRCESSERVIRLERLRLQDDEPIMYCIDYVPRHIIPADLGEVEWSASLLDILERYRARPRMSSASVSAVMLPPEVVERCDLGSFGPALLIKETCFSVSGEPVVYAEDYHRGSHFAFSFARK